MKTVYLSLIVAAAFLGGCEKQSFFGVDGEVWSQLHEKEREQVITAYNKQQEMRLDNARKYREQKMEADRELRKQESEVAPIKAVAEAIAAMTEKTDHAHKPSPEIQAVLESDHKTFVTIEGTKYEISLSPPQQIDHWLKTQSVSIQKDSDPFYNLQITNLDTGDTVKARKVKE